MGRLISLFLFLCLSIAVVLGGYEAHLFLNLSPEEKPGHEVYFDVQPGEGIRTVAKNLKGANLIRDDQYFYWYARLKGQTTKIKAGRFYLSTAQTPKEILHILVYGQAPRHIKITIREGLTWWQTARLLEQKGLVRFIDFQQAITDRAFLDKNSIPFANAEGFLMPDTYQIELPALLNINQAKNVAEKLINNFWKKMRPLWEEVPQAAELKRLLVLASIIEKETSVASERARVAGVYINRLKKNMLLQADPTVTYGLGPEFSGSLLRVHLQDASNKYNTYKKLGLPPGPICSFGKSALVAALEPEQHNFLYFVAKTDGGEHTFSKNLREHNRAVQTYRRNKREAAIEAKKKQ